MAWCRKCCCKPAVNYTAVNHGLDEEEMAFKRSMETQHGDEIDEVCGKDSREVRVQGSLSPLSVTEMRNILNLQQVILRTVSNHGTRLECMLQR